MLYRWFEREGDIDKAAWNAFMNIGYGRTARSPLEARELAMFRDDVDEYVMNRDRLFNTAVKAVKSLTEDYSVRRHKPLAMAGRDTFGEMKAWLDKAGAKGQLTPHDITTGAQIAMIVTGGDMDRGTELTENELLDLERRAFVALGQTAETRDRIRNMLEHGTPLRN